MSVDKKTVVETIVASIVAGAALAAGAEIWSLISPIKRRSIRRERLAELMLEEAED